MGDCMCACDDSAEYSKAPSGDVDLPQGWSREQLRQDRSDLPGERECILSEERHVFGVSTNPSNKLRRHVLLTQRINNNGPSNGSKANPRELPQADQRWKSDRWCRRRQVISKSTNFSHPDKPPTTGIGLSAKFVEAGGGDLIIIYNSGRFRMAGRGSLAGLMPYGNANDVVVDMAKEVLPVVQHTPVIAGVCASDPFRDMPKFLRQLKDLGFAGVQNFPTVGLIDGTFRANLEETGMSYALEVEVVRAAHELDLLTTPYVFNPEDAKAMAEAGADVVVAHMGLTTSGSIGAQSGKSLEDCVREVQAIRDAATGVNGEIIVLCHGGPIAKPEDARFVLERCEGAWVFRRVEYGAVAGGGGDYGDYEDV